jgi:electron transfer flavoprotein beta subunit
VKTRRSFVNCIVCIKQVPDTNDVRINPETNTLVREGVPSIISPFDVYGIEAALQIREKTGGKVTVLTMGPPQAEEALREALAMGADEAKLICDAAFAGSDSWATAYTLSKVIGKLGFDVIFCGKQAIDGDTAQVGPELAEFLDIPHVAFVKKVAEVAEKSITVHRMMDDGYDVVDSSVPVLLTVVKEINVPRLPSLKGKMAAKKAVIERIDLASVGIGADKVGFKGSPTRAIKLFAPQLKTNRKTLEGTLEEQVGALVEDLRRMKCV